MKEYLYQWITQILVFKIYNFITQIIVEYNFYK